METSIACRHALIVPKITFTTDKSGKIKRCLKCKKYYLMNSQQQSSDEGLNFLTNVFAQMSKKK